MSPKAVSHKPTKHVKSRVPIVNVFDEEEKPMSSDLTHAHRPVVIEIEDVAPEQPQAPVMPPPTQVFATPFAPETPTAQVTYPSHANVVTPPENTFESSVQVPFNESQPELQTADQALPSFFEHDLRGNVPVQPGAPLQPQMQQPVTPVMPSSPLESVVPQAVVGEINEAAGGGDAKKWIGIILVILALLVLGIGGLFLFARNLFAPVEVPKSSPTPLPTMRPTTTPVATPAASGSGQLASASAELKKKVKVDVLNGTKVAGLAAKQAALLKAAGYTLGTVGNGLPANAGTIVVAPAYKALADDIAKILKEFTFKIEENAKITSIQVTLGE